MDSLIKYEENKENDDDEDESYNSDESNSTNYDDDQALCSLNFGSLYIKMEKFT